MNANLLPEVFISEANISYKITRLVQQGKVRNITGKLYTSNMTDEIDIIINRRLWEIVGLLFPNSIIAEDFAQKYTRSIDWSDAAKAGDLLEKTNAFTENIDDESAVLKLPKNIL